MQVVVSFLLTLMLLALPGRARWLDGDDGVDRANGDLPGMPIDFTVLQPASDCAQLCLNTTKCVAWAYVKGDCGGAGNPQCYMKATVTNQTYNPCRVSGVKDANLLPPSFRPLPLGTVQPTGWLREQLVIQGDGLSGHLSLFWPDVMDSSWMGGTADSGLHERTPYWLNGFVPLAYQLQDPTLISMAQKYIDYIISHQSADGWLGPYGSPDENMYWSKYPMLLALRQYYEANSSDTRVIPAILKFLTAAHKSLFTIPLGYSWSGARWQDLVLTVHWMLEFHPSGQEQMLWDLAELLHQQGFDWKTWFGSASFPNGSVTHTSLYTHGVNNGQAIKSAGVWWRQSHGATDLKSSYTRMKKLDEYHGQASGVFGCDEHLAGNMPSRGTELCTVVETMFSYETLFGIQGDPIFAERAEMIAFNALPATITPDMWAHQYLQQSNEMNAVHSDDHVWLTDGPDSTLFGLAPNYGCCTANFNQGWPKFVQHLVFAHSDGHGLVVAMYAPVNVQYTLPSGKVVKLLMTTDYPFNDVVTLEVGAVELMTISLRIPSWADGASVQINGSTPVPAKPGTLHNVTMSGPTILELRLPMAIRVVRRYNNAAAIYHGPLLYGLEIMEEFEVLQRYMFESRDYQITPGSSWNYALKLANDSSPEMDLKFVSTGIEIGVPPFSIKGAPTQIMAQGRVLDSWQTAHNAASAPPPSPTSSSNPLQPITLLPFGATELRIAELPTAIN